MSEVIQSEALINLLDRKGIITKEGTPGGDEKGSGINDKSGAMNESY